MTLRCTVKHGFQLTPCSKPAVFRLRYALVCGECKPLLASIPESLFVPILRLA